MQTGINITYHGLHLVLFICCINFFNVLTKSKNLGGNEQINKQNQKQVCSMFKGFNEPKFGTLVTAE